MRSRREDAISECCPWCRGPLALRYDHEFDARMGEHVDCDECGYEIYSEEWDFMKGKTKWT